MISVYNNENNLDILYQELKEKVINKIDYEYEIVMVNDGSQDHSYAKMQELAQKDNHIKILSLSRNFGGHAADLCGLAHCTGDCAVTKSADCQEPAELILEMVEKWKAGSNVVLAVRKGREDSITSKAFAAMYYFMVRKLALKNMPPTGFDTYLVDRKVIRVLTELDEKNSAVTAQILWCGFKTDIVYYVRKKREIGKSGWTFRKKFRLVTDTLFGFSTTPITFVTLIGMFSFLGSIIWAIIVLLGKLQGQIEIQGWTTMMIFNLMSFGIVMITLGILGGYLWRVFDSVRDRPTYIVEDENYINEEERH